MRLKHRAEAFTSQAEKRDDSVLVDLRNPIVGIRLNRERDPEAASLTVGTLRVGE